MDPAADWKRLCALMEDDESVWAAVEGALEANADAWDALIGGLDDVGALAYLRSDDTGMELADALAQLPRVYALQPDLDEVTDTDDLAEAMRAADAALAPEALRLVRLVEEDDEESWPVVAVPVESADAIRSLISLLGHEAASV